MIKYLWLFIILAIVHSTVVVAQSMDSLTLNWTTYDMFEQHPSNRNDSTLTNEKIFDQNEGVFPIADLGVLGSFRQNLNLEQRWNTDDIGLGHNLYYTPNMELKFYQVRKPMTELYYQLGVRTEQKIYLTHTQNVNEYWNIAADFRHLVSDGLYQNQKASVYDVALTSRYTSPENKYQLYGFLKYEETRNQENGGVVSLNFWETSTFSTDSEPINKQSASNQDNSIKIGFRQRWNFGEWNSSDTLNQSITEVKKYFEHQLMARDGKWKYIDESPDSMNYSTFYYSNDETQFKLEDQEINNFLHFGIKNLEESSLQFSVGHKYWTARQFGNSSLDSPFVVVPTNPKLNEHHFKLGVQGEKKISKERLILSIDALFDLKEFQTENVEYSISGGIKQHVGSTELNLKAHLKEQGPSFVQYILESNHYQWENSFNNVNRVGGSLKISNDSIGIHATFGIDQYKSYIYFNSMSLPERYNESLNNYFIIVKKNTTWKNWNFRTSVLYQQTNLDDDQDFLGLPEWSIKQDIGYETNLFKNSVHARIGAEARYLSDFNVSDFNPLIGTFYVNESLNQDTYLRVDAYVRFQIKRARFFFRLDHINQDITAPGNYLVYGYPQQDRNFKFGVNWRFYD